MPTTAPVRADRLAEWLCRSFESMGSTPKMAGGKKLRELTPSQLAGSKLKEAFNERWQKLGRGSLSDLADAIGCHYTSIHGKFKNLTGRGKVVDGICFQLGIDPDAIVRGKIVPLKIDGVEVQTEHRVVSLAKTLSNEEAEDVAAYIEFKRLNRNIQRDTLADSLDLVR